MSAQLNPPPYSDHSNYPQQPPPGNFPQSMPMPQPGFNQPVFNATPVYQTQPVPSVTLVTQQPCKEQNCLKFLKIN